MKIGSLYYQFTSKQLLDAMKADLADRKESRNAWRAFLKKHGAKTESWFSNSSFGEERLVGAIFEKEPDPTLWRRPKNMAAGYEPCRSGPARKLAKEMDQLPRWSAKRVQEIVQWKDIFHEGFMYFFSLFCSKDGSFCGLYVPKFDEASVKRDKDLVYRPKPGMRLITKATYERKVHEKPRRGVRPRAAQANPRSLKKTSHRANP